MSRYAYSLEDDVRAVGTMAASLVPYIYQDTVFGGMPGPLPSLTVGGLLMRLHRLNALKTLLSSEQQTIVETAQKKFDDVRAEWTVAYEGKLKRELPARLRSLNQFLIDCGDKRFCAEIYPAEIEKRAIVASLQSESQTYNALESSTAAQIGAIDSRLRTLTQDSDFVWDARLQPAYPRDLYWYLYRAPVVNR